MESPPPRVRRGYLDWLRGVAVLVMIEAHLLDSWTRSPDRESTTFAYSIILGGFGAPLFLFLAGISVSLSAGSKWRKMGDAGAASRAVMRRGLEIFALAFLFRLQSCILSWGPWWTLFKVDILNIMGPSIVAAAALWRLGSQQRPGGSRTVATQCAVFGGMTAVVALMTPPIRSIAALAALPDPVEGYIRPIPGLTNFIFLPWSAFVFAGAFAGVLIDASRTPVDERRLNIAFGIGGLFLALVAYGASFLPSPYANSYFWTTSPAFFFMRTGILIALIALAYGWQQRPRGETAWSPLLQLGRTSLFIYWIHVELVYGLISLPLHKALSLPAAWAAVVLFSLLMLACSLLKDRVVAWFARRR